MKIQIYSLHSETRGGRELELYTDKTTFESRCVEIITEAADDEQIAEALKRFKAGEIDLDGAWRIFQDESALGNDWYEKDEQPVVLPPQLDRLVAALQQFIGIYPPKVRAHPDVKIVISDAVKAIAAIRENL